MDLQLLYKEMKSVERNTDIVAGGRQLVTRCKFCGDSKTASSHHFYVKLEAPFLFYCQICRATGVLNSEILKYFSVHNVELLTSIDKELKNHSIKASQLKVSYNTNSLPVIDTEVPPIQVNDKVLRNVKYLSDRLDLKLSASMLSQRRVITDFKEFLVHNKIANFSVEPDFLRDLNQLYVGFLSRDGCYITFRDTSPKSPQRYVTYNIFNKSDNLNSFYTIATKIDIMSKTFNIVMAEGIISLQGGYEYCKKLNLDPRSTVFASPSGKNFNSIISFFNKLGLIDINVYFLSDSEVSKYFYIRLIESNKLLSISDSRVNLMYNTIDEDFGVPQSNIKTKLIKLK